MPTVVQGASRTWLVEPELKLEPTKRTRRVSLELENRMLTSECGSDTEAEFEFLACTCSAASGTPVAGGNWERLLRAPGMGMCACRSPAVERNILGDDLRTRAVLSTPVKQSAANPSPTTSFRAGGSNRRRRSYSKNSQLAAAGGD
jgi:hypothetical protein